MRRGASMHLHGPGAGRVLAGEGDAVGAGLEGAGGHGEQNDAFAGTREQVAALGEARKAFEETSAVFEALERIIERGYVDIPRE